MKPQIIRGECLGPIETGRVMAWMESNGVRHYVPQSATITIRGNHFTVETLDIERAPKARVLETKTHGKKWSDWDSRQPIPRRTRKYRIRHELKEI